VSSIRIDLVLLYIFRVIKLSVLQELSYNPGDVLVLVPQNSDQNVRRLFDVLNENRNTHCRIDANTIVQLVERNKDLPVPEMIKRPIILMDCAKKYWDLNVSFLLFCRFTCLVPIRTTA